MSGPRVSAGLGSRVSGLGFWGVGGVGVRLGTP